MPGIKLPPPYKIHSVPRLPSWVDPTVRIQPAKLPNNGTNPSIPALAKAAPMPLSGNQIMSIFKSRIKHKADLATYGAIYLSDTEYMNILHTIPESLYKNPILSKWGL